MRKVKALSCISLVLMMAGCSVVPVKYQIKEGHARLENFTRTNEVAVQNHKEWKDNNYDENTHPYTKETLRYLYAMCNNKDPRPFRLAYQHPAGQHKIWAKAIYGQMEADVLFDVELKPGGNYAFDQRMYKNRRQVEVWIKDLNTGEPYSEVQLITLKRIKIEYEKAADLWTSRCRTGTV